MGRPRKDAVYVAADEAESDETTQETPEDMHEGSLPIATAPKDAVIQISPDGESWFTAYWRKTRKLENFRWVNSGVWSGHLTSATFRFEPKFWRAAP